MHCNLLCFLSEPWHFLTSSVESCNDNHLALYMKVRTIKEGLGNIPEYTRVCSWLCKAGFSGQPFGLTISLCGTCPCLAVCVLCQPSSSCVNVWVFTTLLVQRQKLNYLSCFLPSLCWEQGTGASLTSTLLFGYLDLTKAKSIEALACLYGE